MREFFMVLTSETGVFKSLRLTYSARDAASFYKHVSGDTHSIESMIADIEQGYCFDINGYALVGSQSPQARFYISE
jgi:hypothetical protein